jgi:MFS family permease
MPSDQGATAGPGSPLRTPAFHILWGAMFLSQTGTALLLIGLSTAIYETTRSALAASLVFAALWLLPVLLAPLTARICARHPPRRVLIATEAAAALLCAPIGTVAGLSLAPVFALLLARGFCEAQMKAARGVALKLYIDDDTIEQAASLSTTAMILGAGFGALLSAVMAADWPLPLVSAATCVFYLASAGTYALLGRTAPPTDRVPARGWAFWREVGDLLGAAPALRVPFWSLLITTAAYQGYHTIARTAFPLGYLDADRSAVAAMQVGTIAATALGSVAATAWIAWRLRRPVPWMLFAATSVCLLLPWHVGRGPSAFLAYWTFMAIFELSFSLFQARLMKTCPRDAIATVSTASGMAGLAGMASVVVVGSMEADAVGLETTAWTIAVAAFVLGTGLQRRARTLARPG